LQEPKTNHHYKDGATFDMAFDIYRFDRKLRTLFFNEIEKIEVAVRSAMSNYISESLGDVFWMTNAKYFYNQSLFTKTLLLVQSYEAHLLPYLHHQISAVHGVAKQYVHAKIDVIVGRIFSHRHSRYGLPHHVASRTPLDNITQHFKRLSNRLSNFYS
jgi:abortive infection bacteriophage resistance protein